METDLAYLEFDLSREALGLLVEQAWQSLAAKKITGGLWLDRDSPDASIVLTVIAMRKALAREAKKDTSYEKELADALKALLAAIPCGTCCEDELWSSVLCDCLCHKRQRQARNHAVGVLGRMEKGEAQ